ncbi:hypothetical protein PR003_g6647 [Phytophthora rubi]|uniref:Secreted protein n=1 Tax=Phytophthora rubi TaxID=129364 RepID=A0A6A3J6K5_9STRA|nr:hypothetical protein PR002_g22027 [Phytophthora rubi]KAE8990350.1 hypothetical protein PR001_g21515 [Phytophthora rubi]KAE9347952.1 hypothetical protein PR003_g6647 [Phytophthora rubi]
MNWWRLAAAIYTAVLTAVVAHAAVCYCNSSRASVVNCNTHSAAILHFLCHLTIAIKFATSKRASCCGCTALSTRLGPDLKAHGLRVAGACL